MVVWPKVGLSTLDRRGKPYWDPRADEALFSTLGGNLDDRIPMFQLDSHINDEFAERVVDEFLKFRPR
ncbi:MAG: Tm-1-like ATP-binding domain-containing protein [Deltaproteobacteria bacterium]|nr:Tm-1-like ATP-binding domain-containing protein [Deltaproteobacteria bacterium]MBW2048642.1 Tm-1-like ATP-binding domain-containing protein [Deltaproteobacteria bacterium]MBW2111597.1 Tm-1-like ATP-binding domain-containing protein [Deltaproteobacteria bacterium]MBW2353751.1 Tm-1-like ATP-binding domain-containing protein [Deltaproteobacteria bacterium]